MSVPNIWNRIELNIGWRKEELAEDENNFVLPRISETAAEIQNLSDRVAARPMGSPLSGDGRLSLIASVIDAFAMTVGNETVNRVFVAFFKDLMLEEGSPRAKVIVVWLSARPCKTRLC